MSVTTAFARVYLPDGIAAGTFGVPAAAGAVLLVPSGDGWTTDGGTPVTVFSCSPLPVAGARVGWAIRRDEATYELVVADD